MFWKTLSWQGDATYQYRKFKKHLDYLSEHSQFHAPHHIRTSIPRTIYNHTDYMNNHTQFTLSLSGFTIFSLFQFSLFRYVAIGKQILKHNIHNTIFLKFSLASRERLWHPPICASVLLSYLLVQKYDVLFGMVVCSKYIRGTVHYGKIILAPRRRE